MKFTKEIKYMVVEDYLSNKYSLAQIIKKYDLNGHDEIYLWVGMYQSYGIEGLEPLKYQTYTGEFKQHVVEYMLENKLTEIETCVKFRLNPTQVRKWKKTYIHQGASTLYETKRKGRQPMATKDKETKKTKTKTKTNVNVNAKPLNEVEELQKENEELKKQNYYLTLENECLKKLRALILKK